MNYGKALKIARAISGLQQQEIAKLAGLNPSHVSLIEMGKRNPSMKTVEKLSRALKIPSHLFTLLAAEDDDLKLTNAEEMRQVGESLARLLLSPASGPKDERTKKKAKRRRPRRT